VSRPDPITAWHALLDEEGAVDALGWLAERQAADGIWFGDRPLCTVARPRFLSPAEYDALRRAARPLLGALARIGAAALVDPALRAAFHLAEWEESLLSRLPPVPVVTPFSRIDAFIDPADGVPRLTEFNGETPAGAGDADALSDLFQALPTMHRFNRDWVVRTMPCRPQVLGVLLDGWHRFRGVRSRPTIAIVDWNDVPTLSEFVLIRDYAHRMGVPCLITTPEALQFDGTTLRNVDGTPIDLVYKRVLLHELVARGGLDQPLLQAVAAGAVPMLNPVQGKPLHKKASLAVLTDERHAARFTAAQRTVIHRHVPWTRVVEERHTEIDGGTIDLIPWMQAHRDELVLKPNDDYGGHGIVLGWRVDDSAWHAAIVTALAAPYVVQRRIGLPSEPFPSLGPDGRLVLADRIVDTAPFCWDGTYMDGMLTRISTDPLVNVTAGGGSTVPTFVVEPRT
jgi:hypothetical protein